MGAAEYVSMCVRNADRNGGDKTKEHTSGTFILVEPQAIVLLIPFGNKRTLSALAVSGSCLNSMLAPAI